MSYSDFLIRAGGGNSDGTYYTGSAVLNSSLLYPLTSSVNCRVLNQENLLGQINTRGLYFLSSSVSGGAYVNIPDTKSVSLRMWGRINASYIENAVTLLAKHNGYNIANDEDTYNSNPISGYEFGFRGSGNQLFYRFGNYKTNIDGGLNVFSSPISIPIDRWVGLRMDIIPVKVNKIVNGISTNSIFKDVVKLYTASYDAPDTWVQIGDNYELMANGNQFVPWGSYTVNGSARNAGTTVSTSSYGFSARTWRDNGVRTYFDDFKIFVEDAF
jgi:hypothetical protein